MPILQKVIPAIREEFADAVANGDGIYGVGYCFGGKYILLLASELDDDVAHGQREQSAESQAEQGMVKKGPAIKAGVLAHGTLVSKSDFKGVQVPVGMVCVEDDALFPDDVREHGVKALKERNVEVQDWVHPGVPHGKSYRSRNISRILIRLQASQSLASTQTRRSKKPSNRHISRCWDSCRHVDCVRGRGMYATVTQHSKGHCGLISVHKTLRGVSR